MGRGQLFSNFQESWSNVSQAGSKRVGHGIFCDLLFVSPNLVTIVGQLVRTPPPTEGVSAHH